MNKSAPNLPAVVGSPPVVAKTYDLAELESLWDDFLRIHERHREDGKWLDEFKRRLRELSGEAETINLRGQLVATDYRTGKFSRKQLEADDPELAQQYVKHQWVETFDEESFAKDHPDKYAQYKAHQFLVKVQS
jgi:hypothetical protein